MCVELTAEKTALNSLVTAALGDDLKELKDAWETNEDAEVEGEVLNKNAGSQYGDALMWLCGHLGEVIPPDLWCGVRWIAVKDAGLGIYSRKPAQMSRSPTGISP